MPSRTLNDPIQYSDPSGETAHSPVAVAGHTAHVAHAIIYAIEHEECVRKVKYYCKEKYPPGKGGQGENRLACWRREDCCLKKLTWCLVPISVLPGLHPDWEACDPYEHP